MPGFGDRHESTSAIAIDRFRRSPWAEIRTHKLDELQKDLRAAHQREADAGRRFSEIPADLDALVSEFVAHEDGQPDRFRYPTIRVQEKRQQSQKRQQPPKHQLSFEDEFVLEVERLQARLDAVMNELFGNDATPASELDIAERLLGQQLYEMGAI